MSMKYKLINHLKRNNYKVLDTYFNFDDEELLKKKGIKNTPLYHLTKSLEEMTKCDTIYFYKGWESTRGCKIEHDVAKVYGLEIIYEQ